MLAFLIWKVATIKSQVGREAVLDDWRFGCSLYFCKMLTGFFASRSSSSRSPCLVFAHSRAYDGLRREQRLRAGSQRLHIRWAQRRHDMLVRFGTPGYIPGLGEWIEYR